jgi:hypothetical protein
MADTTMNNEAKLSAMVDSIWEHREELARMAQELPRLLQETGAQMRDAGARAQQASAYLEGDVRTFAGNAADMLEAAKHQLLAVLQALEKGGGMLKNLPFIGEMGKMMGDQLGAIGEVANNLDQVGQKVRGLGDRLGNVGEDLRHMGTSLLGSGEGLSSYGAPPAPAKRPTARKKATQAPSAPTKKKANAKKSAAAAKKASPKTASTKKAGIKLEAVSSKPVSPKKKVASKQSGAKKGK